MLHVLRPAPLAPVPGPHLADPTPTLRLLAGEHAARVAGVWPAPHGAYLAMPAQRRHLTHLVLATSAAPREVLAVALEGARTDAVARDFLGDTPTGFMKALGRLGELAWAGADYLVLLSLFEDADAAAVLRQAASLTPEAIAALAALSAPLRVAAVARHLSVPAHGALLDEVFRAIVTVRGAEAAGVALSRWARAADVARLFEMAAGDMAPVRFDLAAFPVHEDIRRFGGVTALDDAGRRFRNCLAIYRDQASDGSMALYEWAGPPPAAFALRRDGFFGWRLEEARGVANTLLDAGAQARLTATLTGLGVRVGLSGRDLTARLLRAAGKDHAWIDEDETALAAFGV